MIYKMIKLRLSKLTAFFILFSITAFAQKAAYEVRVKLMTTKF